MATHRANGKGSVEQNGPNDFTARLRYVSPTDGKMKTRKKRHCKSEAEANKVIKAWAKEIAQPTFVDIRKDSVEDFMLNWLHNFKQPDLKPTSYDRLELTVTKHIIPYIGKQQMGSISADTIQQHLNKLQKEGKSFSTIKKVYDAFNACFKWGIACRKLQFNPIGAVTVPGAAKMRRTKKTKSIARSTVKFFTPEEQDKLVAAATAKYPNGTPVYRFGYVIPFLLNTGLRLGEMLALQWDRDVHLEERYITVDNSLVLVKNRDASSENKTTLLNQDSVKSDAGERTIYLNDEALDALNHLHEITGNQTYVLSSKTGKPIQPSNIERLMRTARERAGLPKGKNLGPHALRHSFATNLFRQHIDAKIISELLGHADVSITLNIYTHVLDDQKKDALVKIVERKSGQKDGADQ